MATNDRWQQYLDTGRAWTEMSRAQAEAVVRDLVKAGEVQQKRAKKAVDELLERSRKNAEELRIAGEGPRCVSRAGEKLDAALDHCHIDVSGLPALDVGASTGGFTDCLLQRGAARVVAVDVGRGQLHQRLGDDPRVTVVDR